MPQSSIEPKQTSQQVSRNLEPIRRLMEDLKKEEYPVVVTGRTLIMGSGHDDSAHVYLKQNVDLQGFKLVTPEDFNLSGNNGNSPVRTQLESIAVRLCARGLIDLGFGVGGKIHLANEIVVFELPDGSFVVVEDLPVS